jgi:hypothetical protein
LFLVCFVAFTPHTLTLLFAFLLIANHRFCYSIQQFDK